MSPIQSISTVKPSDTDDIPMTDALIVDGEGTVRVRMMDGNDATFIISARDEFVDGVLTRVAQATLPIHCMRVYRTGTTVANIVAAFLGQPCDAPTIIERK